MCLRLRKATLRIPAETHCEQAYNGNASVFLAVYGAMRDRLRVQQVKMAVAARDASFLSILTMAALSQNNDMLRAALAALEKHLTTGEVKEVMMAGSGFYGNILTWAAASGCKDVFEATLIALRSQLTQNEVVGLMMCEGRDHAPIKNILIAAATGGDEDTWEAVMTELERSNVEVKKFAMVDEVSYGDGKNVLKRAVQGGSVATFEAVLTGLKHHQTPEERKNLMDDGSTNLLHTAAESGSKSMLRAVLTALGQDFEPSKIDQLVCSGDMYGRSILHFAAKSGSKAMFEADLDAVNEDEVKSMMSFPGDENGVSLLHAAAYSGCKEVFEAVIASLERRTPDKLKLAITSKGRSDVSNSIGDYNATILHSAAHSGSKAVVEAVLAKVNDENLDPDEVQTMLTFVSKGRDERSVLHSAALSGSKDVFEAILAVLEGSISALEVKSLLVSATPEDSWGLLAAAVMGGSIELLQLVVDKVGQELVLFGTQGVESLLLIVADAGSASMWQAVTDASRKLCKELLSEMVVFSMIGELVKFDIVIFVVMFGFAMSFYALFRDVDTFGQTFLTLFKGMLGEVGFFDDILEGERTEYEEVATALSVIYLVMIAVMLLNLLIAVLSTSHAKVQEKAEQEFRVSRELLIDHYLLVVDKHLLPPPFNLVQLVLSPPFALVDRCWHGTRYTRAKEAVGKMVFWLLIGPLAEGGGTALWLLSAVYAPFAWHRQFFAVISYQDPPTPSPTWKAIRYVLVIMWCIVGAPLDLFAFWLSTLFKWIGLQPFSWIWDRRRPWPDVGTERTCMDELLRDCPGGLSVGELQAFLEEPMSDPEVRQDEKSRPTTVQHIKQLRDRVESNLGKRLQHLKHKLGSKLEATKTQLDDLGGWLDRRQREVDASLEKIDRKMENILAIVQSSLTGGRDA